MIADYIAGIAVGLRALNLAMRTIRHKPGTEQPSAWRRYAWSLLSGALFANAVPHFVRGVSGMEFPAPFSSYLGTGYPTAIANVIWGCLNFAVGYDLLTSARNGMAEKRFASILLASGFVLMSIFLAIVFSRVKGDLA